MAAPLLLDTHGWVWWVGGSPELPERTRRHIQSAFAENRLWVSAISAWEVALLVQRGRLELRLPVREWVARSEALSGLQFLPIDTAIGLRAVELADLHQDPADRMIVASAELLGAVLVTRDQRLRAYGCIRTTWG
ncbi:MAG: type II toxin-antitoxin system VapC family toxin [Chloroflexi bacterium]|nr:type II toxin-antitoxin system VapC family toxin [Chloroflexota bacterium]